MTPREKFSSGTIWEEQVGYSRAVKVGNNIYISGTTSVIGDKIEGIDDPFKQTKIILEKIKTALNYFGADMEHIVRLRIYSTNVTQFDEIALACREYFKDLRPAQTFVGVNALVVKEMLVEIEAEAVI
ncbi:MAG TPA: hypothetical protein DEP28_00805 [Bacteroidetes bacterium]|nr:hypothetical protein [Bacteroidota bacterium]HCN38411.1 hypothetical protein [Bacteroidota bacterium]